MNLIAAFLYAVSLGGGTIQGIVRTEGSGEPIASAVVSIPELQRRTITDARGFFVLAGLPDGSWRAEASGLGYRGNGVAVVIANGNTIRLDFDLAVLPVALPRVVVQSAGDSTALRVPDDPGPAPVRINGAALKTLPGVAEADVFRALQALPSIGTISDYSTAFYVRGGSGEQNLIQLDGIPLYNPYHLGGLFSAIGADAISTVEVWPGALPARLGDRLSSAIVIHTLEGGKDQMRSRGSIGLISTNLTIDGPLNAGRGSFLFSGRRTYLDLFTEMAYRLDALEFTIPYDFTDAYFKLTHTVGESGLLSLSGYWDGEKIDTPDRVRNEITGYGEFNWGSRLLSVYYRQSFGGAWLLEGRAGYTDFKGVLDSHELTSRPLCPVAQCGIPPLDTVLVVEAHTLARSLLTGFDVTRFGRHHTLRAGFQIQDDHFDNRVTAAEDKDPFFYPRFAEQPRTKTIAAYLEDDWKPNDKLGVRAGLRVLDAGSLGRAFLPRLGARYQFTPSLAITAGAGYYAQSLRSMKDDESALASLIAYDLLTAQPDEAGLARSNDVVLGLNIGSRGTLSVEGFYKRLDRLVLGPAPLAPIHTSPLVVDSFRIGQGRSYGMELSLRQQNESWNLGAGYTLQWAERRAGADVFTPRFERRHEIDASAEYRWGSRGLLSARLVMATGQPTTPIIGLNHPFSYDPTSQQWTTNEEARPLLGPHNSERLDGYLRLDIAARRSYERRWFGRPGTLTPYLQVVNVLNTKNALLAESHRYSNHISYWPQLPILPSLGVEWKF
jgi:outer membrane receptor protein involved in Fe transport